MGKRVKVKHNNFLWKIGVPIIVILVIIIIFSMDLSKGNTDNKSNFVLTVNGTYVPKEEFSLFLQDEKASTASYFYQKYGVQYSEDFWKRKYGNEVPIEVARSKAISKLVKVKVEQELAVNYGILKNTSFDDIQGGMKKEKSIYGAESLNLFQEYGIYHSKILLETKQKFKIKSAAIKEQELLQYYNTHKMDRFKEPDVVKVQQFLITNVDAQKKDEIINSVLQDIQRATSKELLAKKYSGLCTISMQNKQYGSKESKDENSSEMEAMLKEQAYMLSKNEVSKPIQYGSQYFIITCLERTEGKTAEFQEVKASIEDLIKEEKFELEVEDKIKKASININKKIFDLIQIQ